MSKYDKLDLEELYELAAVKATPGIVQAIVSKEDFSSFKHPYWDIICKTPGKPGPPISVDYRPVDILVIQNNLPFPEKYKKSGQLTAIYERQIRSMVDASIGFTSLMKTPAVPFRTPKGKVSSTYTITHARPYLPYLLEEIRRRKPKVLVSLDTNVTKLLGLAKSNGGNKGNRGEIHISPLVGLPVVITLNPRFLNMIRQQASGGTWGDDYYSVIKRDMEKAVQLLEVKKPALEDAVKEVASRIHVCESIEDVRYWTDIMCKLPAGQFTSWDLETTSLDPWSDDARILTSQVGMRIDGEILNIVIPLWHKDNKGYDPQEAFDIHRSYLERDSAKVGHNITFDIVFLAVTTGVRLKGTIVCTLLALHSMDSGITGCYGLKTAVWDHLPWSGLGGYEDLLEWSGS
jgi:hypothetical protein